MRIYELCLILHSDTVEEQQERLLQSITEIIAGHKGSVLKTEKWGKKNFKFVIRKQSKGHYCFLVFEAPVAALKDIERTIMYNESILRYNFIRLEKFEADAAEPAAAAQPAAVETEEETVDSETEAEAVETQQAAETQE